MISIRKMFQFMNNKLFDLVYFVCNFYFQESYFHLLLLKELIKSNFIYKNFYNFIYKSIPLLLLFKKKKFTNYLEKIFFFFTNLSVKDVSILFYLQANQNLLFL